MTFPCRLSATLDVGAAQARGTVREPQDAMFPRESQAIAQLVDLGVKVPEWMFGVSAKLEASYTEIYPLNGLPDRWPFKLFNQFLGVFAEHATKEDVADVSSDTLVALIPDEAFNAYAWPANTEININRGLWTTFFISSFASAIPAGLHLQNISLPSEVAVVADALRDAAARIVVTQDPGERFEQYILLTEARARLSDDYPELRPLVEQFATGVVNTATAYVFLHEYCHLLLRHGDAVGRKAHPIRQELEADWKAAEIMTEVLLREKGMVSFVPALVPSFLEAQERVSNNGKLLYGGPERGSHPPADFRRWRLLRALELIARPLASSVLGDGSVAVVDFAREQALCIHMGLSRVLVDGGLPPVSSFVSSDYVELAGLHVTQARLGELGHELGVPRAVVDAEYSPFRGG